MPIDSSIAGNNNYISDVTVTPDSLLIHLDSAVYDIHINQEGWGNVVVRYNDLWSTDTSGVVNGSLSSNNTYSGFNITDYSITDYTGETL